MIGLKNVSCKASEITKLKPSKKKEKAKDKVREKSPISKKIL